MNKKLVLGNIEGIKDGCLYGWIYSPLGYMKPMVTIDGIAAELIEEGLERKDVMEKLKIPDRVGFKFRIENMADTSSVSLYGLNKNTETLVASKKYTLTIDSDKSNLDCLYKAYMVSQRKKSVCIVCWDGAHNAIGRAKVLYDILKSNDRPVFIFAFHFFEFGATLWPPLATSNTDIFLIPWRERFLWSNYIQNMCFKFKTLWLCKPRLPTFELATHIACSDSAVILDMDDNEKTFSLSAASKHKIYGIGGTGLSTYYSSKINSKTVASASLQKDFGGYIVRHAREKVEDLEVQKISDRVSNEIAICFLGTVRPHKNILEAAKVLRAIAWKRKINIKFYVYGDISPEKLKHDLMAYDVYIKPYVSIELLQAELMPMDIILTGFVSANDCFESITKYQITAKIGDALRLGKPVLVPETPGVADLFGVPGIFLFNADNFEEIFFQAANYNENISLPYDFTLAGAYEAFCNAEKYSIRSPRACQIFLEQNTSEETFLLIWKQNDAGLYGRRIDQVARSIKKHKKNARVIVFEFIHKSHEENIAKLADGSCFNDASLILSLLDKKKSLRYKTPDGVEYHALHYSALNELHNAFYSYVLSQGITPSNTRIIIYPYVKHLHKVMSILKNYTLIIDVVDNHFAWASVGEDIYSQYRTLLMIGSSIVFNSTKNFDYFYKMEPFKKLKAKFKIIPNWYQLPQGFSKPVSGICQYAPSGIKLYIAYSGNMNDRVDWDILIRLAKLSKDFQLVLIGSASRADEKFFELISYDNVMYLGPKDEISTLELLSKFDICIIPHIDCCISTYMNPLKLHMYNCLNIPTVSSCCSGLDASCTYEAYQTDLDFFNILYKHLQRKKEHHDAFRMKTLTEISSQCNEMAYIDMVNACAYNINFCIEEWELP